MSDPPKVVPDPRNGVFPEEKFQQPTFSMSLSKLILLFQISGQGTDLVDVALIRLKDDFRRWWLLRLRRP